MKINVDLLIERWENGLRVLEAMTPHEKKNHFNMALWGEKTDCGTVACAAGHMSLDPWFRRRGFCSVWRDEMLGDTPVLDPTRLRRWDEMINEFFYVDQFIEDDLARGYLFSTPAQGSEHELEILATQAVQIFYDGGETYSGVVRHIRGTIQRLKDYRERVKKERTSTTSVAV